MKKVAFLFSIISAIYWSSPAMKFNIAQADQDTSATSRTKTTDVLKPQLQAHSFATQTFLNASLVYLDGLDRQLKADVPLSNAVIKQHVDIYVKQSMDTLKNARVHIGEYIGTMSRAPASDKQSKDVNEARNRIDDAIKLNQSLWDRVQDTSMRTDKSELRDEVSRLKSAVKTALHDTKSLKFSS